VSAIVKHGHSHAYGARFLKRVIDERVRLPISANWRETQFHVRVEDGDVVVDAGRSPHPVQAVA
jgi:hypothetical protein